MRALFGALALLIVLAVVGLVVARQTRALKDSRAVLPAAESAGSAATGAAAPTSSRAAEAQITRDIGRAFEAASAARAQAIEP